MALCHDLCLYILTIRLSAVIGYFELVDDCAGKKMNNPDFDSGIAAITATTCHLSVAKGLPAGAGRRTKDRMKSEVDLYRAWARPIGRFVDPVLPGIDGSLGGGFAEKLRLGKAEGRHEHHGHYKKHLFHKFGVWW